VAQNGPIDAALEAELEQPPPWMYAWRLATGVVAPVLDLELPSIHLTRLELMEAQVRAALSAAGPDAAVIDLACNEGWFSHRMLEWGACRVLGVDIRERVIQRAELLRTHFGIPSERLQFRCGDVFELDVSELGTFDVVLCLGLLYHLENPIGAVRIARTLTRGICVIESQLTRQTEDIVHGWGASDRSETTPASFAARVETDSETNMLASSGGVVSLIPNRAALIQAAEVAGFAKLEVARPAPDHNAQYVQGDRAVLLAWPPDHADRVVAEGSLRRSLDEGSPSLRLR
jgi:tRNA (mo5U34)-methyltransferase